MSASKILGKTKHELQTAAYIICKAGTSKTRNTGFGHGMKLLAKAGMLTNGFSAYHTQRQGNKEK